MVTWASSLATSALLPKQYQAVSRQRRSEKISLSAMDEIGVSVGYSYHSSRISLFFQGNFSDNLPPATNMELLVDSANIRRDRPY